MVLGKLAKMKIGSSILSMALAAVLAAPATAQQSEVLFAKKQWQVELVAWDDGVLGCVAQVDERGEIFALWTFQDSAVQLQFYSPSWSFGEGDLANLQVQIDKMAPWNLTDAELSQNSVLFTLPDSDAGVEFIVEVAKGNRIYLRSEDGSDVQSYSLAGSRASIDALLECGEVITQEAPKNPFN